jgi:hypothetical protein
VTASQLLAWLQAETGASSPAQAPGEYGRLLRESVFSPGASVRWDALVERATGRPLDTRAFVDGLTR